MAHSGNLPLARKEPHSNKEPHRDKEPQVPPQE